MAGVAAATAAGAALLLYYSGRSTNRAPWPLKLLKGAQQNGPPTEEGESADVRSPGGLRSARLVSSEHQNSLGDSKVALRPKIQSQG